MRIRMQIVIDIPDNEYTLVKNREDFYVDRDNIVSYVRNGKPLPKGHGRLIDEKDLSLMTVHIIDGVLVYAVPTIIEADTTESEVEE